MDDSKTFSDFLSHVKNKDKVDVTITSEGQPVEQSEIPDYLKTILSENLEINSNLAKERLKEPFDKSEFELC